MKNFKCEDIVMDTSYFISEHFKIISKQKKSCGLSAKRYKQKPDRKKLAGIFSKFFWFYMELNVPVVFHEMLLYETKY